MIASTGGGYNGGGPSELARGGRGDVATNELTKLASGVEGQAAVDGVYATAVPALRLSRFSAPSDLAALEYEPCLCMVAQGAKEVLLNDATYRLDPAQSLLVSLDLPITARVVEASQGRPYLAVRLALDPAVVGELLADGTTTPPLGPPARAIAVIPAEPPLLDAVSRLVALLDSPPRTSGRWRRSCSAKSRTAYSPARRGCGCGRSPAPAPRPTGSPAQSAG